MSEKIIIRGLPEHTFTRTCKELGSVYLQITIGKENIALNPQQTKDLLDSLNAVLGISIEEQVVKTITKKLMDAYSPALESWIRSRLYPSRAFGIVPPERVCPRTEDTEDKR